MQTRTRVHSHSAPRRPLAARAALFATVLVAASPAYAFDFTDLRTPFGRDPRPEDFFPKVELVKPVEHVPPAYDVPPIEKEPSVERFEPVPAYKTFVKTKNQLAAAGLWAETHLAAEYLTRLHEALEAGLKRNRYWLIFRGVDAPTQEHVIRNREGVQLTSVVRMDRFGTKCSSMFSVDDEEIGGGSSLESATRGICGVIAVLHSLEKLDLVGRDQLVEGDHLRQNVVDGVKRRYMNRRTGQMTKKKLRKAHQDFGTGACREQNDALTANEGGLDNFVKALNGFVNDPEREWDCTLYLSTGSGRNTTLAHYEHVTGMTTRDSGRGRGGRTILNAEITTMNGFAQGDQSSTVPATPGTNTWSLRPGGNTPMSMTGARNADGGNDRETRDRLAAVPSVQRVSFICCPGPARD